MTIFTHEKVSKHMIRIRDVTGVCCYLVIGEKKACLLDTCNGIGNIREYVETITQLPIMVILTHGHLDHMGGAGLFDEIYMNHADIPVFEKHGDMNFRIEDVNAHSSVQFDKEEFILTYDGPISDIEDGQQFDLGNVTIKMLLVKGHTPGIMCPLIIEDRVIVFGDACGVSVLLFDELSSCVSEYRESLLQLKQYEAAYDIVYRNHGTFISPKEVLDNVIECCDLILSDKDNKLPVAFHGIDLFSCHTQAENGHGRADGKEGNILYSQDKKQ